MLQYRTYSTRKFLKMNTRRYKQTQSITEPDLTLYILDERPFALTLNKLNELCLKSTSDYYLCILYHQDTDEYDIVSSNVTTKLIKKNNLSLEDLGISVTLIEQDFARQRMLIKIKVCCPPNLG